MVAVACILIGWFAFLTVFFATDRREPLTPSVYAQYVIDMWLKEMVEIQEYRDLFDADGQW